MYVIRVRDGDEVLGVSLSGHVGPDEALRAVSQAFALAEAGGIDRCICDLRELSHGTGSLVVLGTGLFGHIAAGQRVALVCSGRQLSTCRKLARIGGFDERLGIFTRESDALEWLESSPQQRLGQTALRHFQVKSARVTAGQARHIAAAG